jgi:hypothetical protein
MLTIRLTALAGIALAAACVAVVPASALTTKECSVKYQAAKEAGTLGDMKWNDFRKTQCAADVADDQPAAKTAATKKAKTTTDDDQQAGLTSKQCSAKYQAAKEAGTLNGMKWNEFRKAECGPGASAEIETPKAKTKKAAASADDTASGLSMKQCSAKYQAAKEADALGGMKWNEFRKEQCGPGASAEFEAPKAKVKKAAKSDDDTASGLSMKECSAKYQAAKEANVLGDTKWNEFRKEQCGPGASAEIETTKTKTKKTANAPDTSSGLTMKECGAKYQAAKEAGSLGGLKWNGFRKAKCGPDASDDESVPAPSEAEYTNEPDKPTIKAPRSVKFPRAISSKFSNESEGKARMHTCLDQYYANKDNNALGGLKWIQKGGGYYSLCNARLKGETS